MKVIETWIEQTLEFETVKEMEEYTDNINPGVVIVRMIDTLDKNTGKWVKRLVVRTRKA